MKAPAAATAALAFLVCILAAVNISAATLVVTKTEDTDDGVCDADCSLREAVAVAAPDDTVIFSALFTIPQTITLSLGQIAIIRNLTITGTGSDLLTINGNNASRILRISGTVNVNMSGMKLTNGLASVMGDAVGGAIYLETASLSLTSMVITNNVARQATSQVFGVGGGIFIDSGILTAVNSSISNNTAATGIGGGGGVFGGYATIIMTGCTVNSNDGEGIYGTGNSS